MKLKRTGKKNFLWPLILTVMIAVFPLAAQAGYEYYDNWELQEDSLTYINTVQRMVVTFPDRDWKVFTAPEGEVKNIWDRPLWNDSSYNVLIARLPDKKMTMQFIIEPHIVGAVFQDYFEATRHKIDSAYAETHDIKWRDDRLVEREGDTVGVMCYTFGDREATLVIFNERERYVLASFNGPEGVFEKNKDEFWTLVDSYEPLGGVPKVDEYKD